MRILELKQLNTATSSHESFVDDSSQQLFDEFFVVSPDQAKIVESDIKVLRIGIYVSVDGIIHSHEKAMGRL